MTPQERSKQLCKEISDRINKLDKSSPKYRQEAHEIRMLVLKNEQMLKDFNLTDLDINAFRTIVGLVQDDLDHRWRYSGDNAKSLSELNEAAMQFVVDDSKTLLANIKKNHPELDNKINGKISQVVRDFIKQKENEPGTVFFLQKLIREDGTVTTVSPQTNDVFKVPEGTAEEQAQAIRDEVIRKGGDPATMYPLYIENLSANSETCDVKVTFNFSSGAPYGAKQKVLKVAGPKPKIDATITETRSVRDFLIEWMAQFKKE